MNNHVLTCCNLQEFFPKDTLWTFSGIEIVGYSIKENKHIVIDDGICLSQNGEYFVHMYEPTNPKEHINQWFNYNGKGYPMKYIMDDKYAVEVFQGWMQFSKH